MFSTAIIYDLLKTIRGTSLTMPDVAICMRLIAALISLCHSVLQLSHLSTLWPGMVGNVFDSFFVEHFEHISQRQIFVNGDLYKITSSSTTFQGYIYRVI